MLLGRINSELNITSPALIKVTVERNSGKSLLKVPYDLKDGLAKYKYTVLNIFSIYMTLLNRYTEYGFDSSGKGGTGASPGTHSYP